MKNKHLTDIEIQQYLLLELNSRPDIIEHIQKCEECRIKVEEYRIIFEKIKEQEKPVFDFNLEELIAKQLSRNKPEFSFNRTFIYFFVFIAAPAGGIIIYLFSTTLSGLLMGIGPFFIYLVATTVISLFLFLCYDTYARFKKRMNTLSFYQELQQ